MICTNIRRCHQYPANERVEVKKGGGRGDRREEGGERGRQERRRRRERETEQYDE